MPVFRRHDRIRSRITGKSYMVVYDPTHGIIQQGPVYLLHEFWSPKNEGLFILPAHEVESGDFDIEVTTTHGAAGRIGD